jgi:hypothetical protein
VLAAKGSRYFSRCDRINLELARDSRIIHHNLTLRDFNKKSPQADVVAGRSWEESVVSDSASGMHSRRTVLGILAAAVAPMMPGRARGQSQQPIRLNVPFSPGTGPDLLARILSEELRQRWNHPVIVENKPGASGNIGTQAAARTAPDGQNLLVTVNTFV